MTGAEQRLWRGLRELGPPNRFRRQYPIGRYIVDFACPAAKLAIELDGGQHAIRRDADTERSIEIAGHGYRVIRFWNGDVMENLPGVLETTCRELKISLSAPAGGEGRGGGGASPPPPPPASPSSGASKMRHPTGASTLAPKGALTR